MATRKSQDHGRKSVLRLSTNNKVTPAGKSPTPAPAVRQRVSLGPSKPKSEKGGPPRTSGNGTATGTATARKSRRTVVSVENDDHDQDQDTDEGERKRSQRSLRKRRASTANAMHFRQKQELASTLEPTSSIDSLYRNRDQIKPRATRLKRTAQWMRRSLFKVGFDDTENYLFAFASWEVMEKSSGRLTHVLDYLVYRMLELFTSVVFLVYFSSRRRLPAYGVGFWSQVVHILYSTYYAYKIYSLDEARQKVTIAAEEGEEYYKTLAELFNNPPAAGKAKTKSNKVSTASTTSTGSATGLSYLYNINVLKRANVVLWILANLQYIVVLQVVLIDWISIAIGTRKDTFEEESLYNTFTMLYVLMDVFAVSFPIRFGHVIYAFVYNALYGTFSVIMNFSTGEPIYEKVLDWKNDPWRATGYIVCFFLSAVGVQLFLVLLFQIRYLIMVYGADAPELELPSDFETIASELVDEMNEEDAKEVELMEAAAAAAAEHHPEGDGEPAGGRLVAIEDPDLGLTNYKLLREVSPAEFERYLATNEADLTPAERQNLMEEYDQVLKMRERQRADSEAEHIKRSFTRMKFQAASKEFAKLFEKVKKDKVRASLAETEDEAVAEAEAETEEAESGSAVNSVFELAGRYFDENYKPSSAMLSRSKADSEKLEVEVDGNEDNEGNTEIMEETDEEAVEDNEEHEHKQRGSGASGSDKVQTPSASRKTDSKKLGQTLQKVILGRNTQNASKGVNEQEKSIKSAKVSTPRPPPQPPEADAKGPTATSPTSSKPNPSVAQPKPGTKNAIPPKPVKPVAVVTVAKGPPPPPKEAQPKVPPQVPTTTTQTLRKVRPPPQILTKRSVTAIKKTDLLRPSKPNGRQLPVTSTTPSPPPSNPHFEIKASKSGYTLGRKPKDDAIAPNLRKAKGHRNLHELKTAPEPLGDKRVLIVPKGDGQPQPETHEEGDEQKPFFRYLQEVEKKKRLRSVRSRTKIKTAGQKVGDQPSGDDSTEPKPAEPETELEPGAAAPGQYSTSTDRIRVLPKAKSLKRLAKRVPSGKGRPRWNI